MVSPDPAIKHMQLVYVNNASVFIRITMILGSYHNVLTIQLLTKIYSMSNNLI